MYLAMKKNNHFQSMYQKKKFEDELNLSSIAEGENKHYILIKDLNKFMYYKTKHRARKHFCVYC